MKIEIKNDGSRAVAVQGTTKTEVINQRTTRVIEVKEALPQKKVATLFGRGCTVKEVDPETPVTPEYEEGMEPKSKEPTEAERLAALRARADELKVPYGPDIEMDVLAQRVADAEAEADKAAAGDPLADMKARADAAGVEYADNIGLKTLTERVEKAEADKAAE